MVLLLLLLLLLGSVVLLLLFGSVALLLLLVPGVEKSASGSNGVNTTINVQKKNNIRSVRHQSKLVVDHTVWGFDATVAIEHLA